VRVSFAFRVEETGQTLIMLDDAPFDREHGSVLIACQRHFSDTEPNLVAEVRVHDADGGEHLSTYTILHEWVRSEDTST
jgi:hypothetical protein